MKCDRARAEVPRGAWVIRHPDDDPEHVHVVVYDDRRPGNILVVGQFKIATGVFVRVVVNRQTQSVSPFRRARRREADE